MEILWEEEGFQFGFKRWQVEQCLRSCGSEFQMLGPKQEKVHKPWVLRLYCWISSIWVSKEECSVRDGSVDMQQFREVSRTRTIYSTETHTSDFILNMFWNGNQMQFFQERCCVVMTGCQENKSCSKILNFLERLDDRIRCTHKETVAVVKPWKDVGSNKSLGCVFSEKPADWTNVFKLKISSLADFYDYASSWTVLSQEWIQGSWQNQRRGCYESQE